MNDKNLTDQIIVLLVRQGLPVLAEHVAILSESEREATLRGNLTASDRDNRRRRMDIAAAILDETAVTDLEAIAGIIWPEFREVPERPIPMGGFNYPPGTMIGDGPHGLPKTPEEMVRHYAEDVAVAPIDQPTQVPTEVPAHQHLLNRCAYGFSTDGWCDKAPVRGSIYCVRHLGRSGDL